MINYLSAKQAYINQDPTAEAVLNRDQKTLNLLQVSCQHKKDSDWEVFLEYKERRVRGVVTSNKKPTKDEVVYLLFDLQSEDRLQAVKYLFGSDIEEIIKAIARVTEGYQTLDNII